MTEMIQTSEGLKTIGNVLNDLAYSSYAANRSYGMSHESAVRIGLGNDEFKKRYEATLHPVTDSEGDE